MAKRFFLTERQVAQLKELLRLHRNQVTGPNLREGDQTLGEAPDVYVVLPQEEEGIPGLTPGETDEDLDVAGSTTCDAYRIVYNEDDEPELTDMGLELTVLNLAQIPLPQDWTLAVRSKDGCYYAVGPYPPTDKCGITDEALEEGGSVTVSIWDHSGDSWADTGENQEDVYDSFWYQGMTLPAGIKVKIRYCPENERWEIVWVPWLDGVMAADLNYNSTATMTVWVTGEGYTGTITVHAPHVISSSNDKISSGKRVTAKWKSQASRWEVVERDCE